MSIPCYHSNAFYIILGAIDTRGTSSCKCSHCHESIAKSEYIEGESATTSSSNSPFPYDERFVDNTERGKC